MSTAPPAQATVHVASTRHEHCTLQYQSSENKIVFGLKVPSGDGLGLILSLK